MQEKEAKKNMLEEKRLTMESEKWALEKKERELKLEMQKKYLESSVGAVPMGQGSAFSGLPSQFAMDDGFPALGSQQSLVPPQFRLTYGS